MIVAFDTETYLIEPGQLAPKMVCLTYDTGDKADIELADAAIKKMKRWLADPSVRFVGHNVAFDMAVLAEAAPHLLPAIFTAYTAGRVSDTKVRDQLLMLSEGRLTYDHVHNNRPKYSLSALSERHFGVSMAKGEDTWRLRYAELDGVPLSSWPDEALIYAIGDATATRRIFVAQTEYAAKLDYLTADGLIVNEIEQAQAAWALHLMSCWGLRTDGDLVEPFLTGLGEEQAAVEKKLLDAGLLKWTRKGRGADRHDALGRNMAEFKRRCAEGYEARGKEVPTTPGGSVKTDAESLLGSGDKDLMAYADESGAEKIISSWGDYLRLGTEKAINHSYNTIMETGRTSAYRPNTQNLHRRGGLRECFVPRPGFVFVGADYSFVELCTLAQSCIDRFGKSDLAEAINDGLDPHVHMAATLLNLYYDDAYARYLDGDKKLIDMRQLSKAANFGLPGGMGPDSFAAFAWASYRVRIPEALLAREQKGWMLKNLWMERWPEMAEHFSWVNDLDPFGNPFTLELPRSGRKRGGCTYTPGCNNLFQGPAADGAKRALFALADRCYVGDLQGCRPVLFVHDEIIAEVPEDMVTVFAGALTDTMVAAMRVETPNVKIRVEAHAMRRWYKGAKPVTVDGELIPWEPT